MSVDDIYRNFHTPRETKIHRVDGAPLGPEVPEYSVMPAQTLIVCDEVSDPRICISDFGEAWLSTDTPPEDLHTPLPYLPPETTFARDQFGFPADVWTLACSVYEIMGERMLYEVYFGDRDDVLAEMVSCLGPLPQHWRDAWQAWGKFFQEDGSWRTDMTRHDSKSRPLHQRVFHDMGRENDPEFSIAEAESLERMLRAMFQYEPAKRATIDDVVKSDWMTHWGLPSLQTYNIQPHKPQDTLLSQRSVTEAGNVRASPTAGVTRP
ncbi:MAG: hypothetical protein L6R39_001729 [Caloplaca ligustica]|nr:MAG: hypothetical protein L6R39_001729 [Caloplaca ligustica]